MRSKIAFRSSWSLIDVVRDCSYSKTDAGKLKKYCLELVFIMTNTTILVFLDRIVSLTSKIMVVKIS